MFNFYEFDLDRRCLISPTIGCHAACTYCYCNHTKQIIGDAEKIIRSIVSDKRYVKGETIISLGCYTECLAPRVLPLSLDIAKYFLKEGHRVSVATKMDSGVLLGNGLSENFYVFISCPTVSYSQKYERGVEEPQVRLSRIADLQKAGITPVLYIKPFLPETPEDVSLFLELCSTFRVDVVVGRYFSPEGRGKKVALINDVYFEELSQLYDDFFAELGETVNVFHNSIEVLNR